MGTRENRLLPNCRLNFRRQARMARKLAWAVYLRTVPEDNWKSLYEDDGTIKKKSETYARTIYVSYFCN